MKVTVEFNSEEIKELRHALIVGLGALEDLIALESTPDEKLQASLAKMHEAYRLLPTL